MLRNRPEGRKCMNVSVVIGSLPKIAPKQKLEFTH